MIKIFTIFILAFVVNIIVTQLTYSYNPNPGNLERYAGFPIKTHFQIKPVLPQEYNSKSTFIERWQLIMSSISFWLNLIIYLVFVLLVFKISGKI